MALVNYVCNPDAADLETEALTSLEKFIPKWFVEFLRLSEQLLE